MCPKLLSAASEVKPAEDKTMEAVENVDVKKVHVLQSSIASLYPSKSCYVGDQHDPSNH